MAENIPDEWLPIPIDSAERGTYIEPIETNKAPEGSTMATFNGVWLNGESVQAARQFFADNCDKVIAEAKAGAIKCDSLADLIEWQTDVKRMSLRGEYDHSLTHMQRAYFIQTGHDVALLP